MLSCHNVETICILEIKREVLRNIFTYKHVQVLVFAVRNIESCKKKRIKFIKQINYIYICVCVEFYHLGPARNP